MAVKEVLLELGSSRDEKARSLVFLVDFNNFYRRAEPSIARLSTFGRLSSIAGGGRSFFGRLTAVGLPPPLGSTV